jgi:hypothetical protein
MMMEHLSWMTFRDRLESDKLVMFLPGTIARLNNMVRSFHLAQTPCWSRQWWPILCDI